MISREQLAQITGTDAKHELEELKIASDTFLAILDHLEAREERVELSVSQYDSPSWAYRQAHINGARQVYQTLRQYLTKESKTNG